MYPTCSMVLRTTPGMSIQALVVISPATSTRPVVAAVSQATRAGGSWTRMASRTASEIWSQSLSGWPSVTDSLVKYSLGFSIKLLKSGSFRYRYTRADRAGLSSHSNHFQVLRRDYHCAIAGLIRLLKHS